MLMEHRAVAEPAVDFKALFAGTPNLYLVLTPEFTIVAANDAYCRATMTSRGQILGRGIFDVFPHNPKDPGADGVQNLRASLERVLRLRRPDAMPVQKYDIPVSGGGFEERHWSPLNTPVLDAKGDVAWIIHRVEDVTENMRLQAQDTAHKKISRKQSETIAQLQETNRVLALQNEENARLRQHVEARTVEIQNESEFRQNTEGRFQYTSVFLDTVIENLPVMLVVKDAKDGRFMLFNRTGEQLLGIDRTQYLGKNDYDFFPKEQADHFTARDREVMDSLNAQVTPEEAITTRHQGVRLLRTTKVPIMDKEGQPRYLLSLSEDITDRKATEQQLRQAVKMEAVGQLTGGLAHDFNNLLGVVIGSLDLVLERDSIDGTCREPIQGALDAALRGAELVQRLLAFSRKQSLHPTVINLNDRLPHIATLLRRTLGEQNTVEVRPSVGLWPTSADPSQTEEAILNLAINARDAMPNGGRLTIETANAQLDEHYAAQHAEVKAGDYVLLAVSDTGQGMTPEILERAFEPFFTTKAVDKGTGLGLSMVYGFVKQSKGHIKIYSEVGHGTTVKIYLPRADLPQSAAASAESSKADVARGRELVLVVEDNEGMRTVTLNQLKELGYQTLSAENANAALTVLDSHPDIDILFTDLVMPGGMSGCDLAREARRRRPGLKILLTSGYTAHAMTNGYHDIEGLELLNKPFRKRDLAAKLRHVLDSAGGETASVR